MLAAGDAGAPRILQVITNLGKGGAETQLAYLAACLRERGWIVHVAYVADGLEDRVNERRLMRAGVELHRLPTRGSYDPLAILRLVRLIRSVRPRLVQTWLPMGDVVGGLAALVSRVPWILTERASWLDYTLDLTERTKMSLRARLARCASGVVSNSQGGDRYWRGLLPASLPRSVIGNAVLIEEIETAEAACPTRFGLQQEGPLLLYVGRLMELKNISVLLEALARVVSQTSAVALLCGVGPFEQQARSWIDERGLSQRIALAGFLPDVAGLYRRAALFVSLSRTEGMPNTLMEAMAAGKASVLSDIPAHRDVADESMATFVSLDDPNAAASAMLAILADAEARDRMGENARARAGQWSIASIARAYEAFYHSVLRGGAVRS